jgi:dTDP-glucose 4,6-dehydratase
VSRDKFNNIGAENEMQNIQIIKLILGFLGKSENLIEFVKDRLGHDRRYAIDATKIKTELGWKPEFSFEQAIVKTVEWYLNNKSWWERIIAGTYRDYYKNLYGKKY